MKLSDNHSSICFATKLFKLENVIFIRCHYYVTMETPTTIEKQSWRANIFLSFQRLTIHRLLSFAAVIRVVTQRFS